MIIPCINSTSLGEGAGNVARVEEGSVFVGCPGAPGCTTTGDAAVCACVGRQEAPHNVHKITPRNTATCITRSFGTSLKWMGFICLETSKMKGLPYHNPSTRAERQQAWEQRNLSFFVGVAL